MRRCFIHIGTHKTGTTSIQHLLDRHRTALARAGYVYPRTGQTALPGQHNLAWAISGDRRFKTDYGTIANLISEVRDETGDMVLSSEDFECALYSEIRFSEFISLLQSYDFSVIAVMYVRSQVDYLPRIYLTLLHFGLEKTFAEVLREVLDRGRFSWREWIFNFDYVQQLADLAKIPNVKTVVRSYDRARRGICDDFLSVLNLKIRDFAIEQEPFENVSLPLKDYLSIFLSNRIGRPLLRDEEEAVTNMVPVNERAIAVSPDVQEQIVRRFADSNRQLLVAHGIPEPVLNEHDRHRHRAPFFYVDELFVEDTGQLKTSQ